MIYLGLFNEEKVAVINKLMAKNAYDRIYFITHKRFNLPITGVEVVTYEDIIEYAYYYRIIENTTQKTLIILNELLRDKNRNNLTFNCIRTFLNNTNNILIFNFLPIIESRDSFCALYDFETQNKYKYSKFDELDFSLAKTNCRKIDLNFNFIKAPVNLFDLENYEAYKKKLFHSFNKKDPDVIPRELQLFASKVKEQLINQRDIYVVRNKRMKHKNTITYKNDIPEGIYKIFDIPFNYLDFIDFVFFSKQQNIDIISSDLKVDVFFESRLQTFKNELDYVYSKIYHD
jgi:hypothetical protein